MGEMQMKKYLMALALASISSTAAAADLAVEARGYVQKFVTPWASNPLLIAAISAQNAAHATLEPSQILELDQVWRSEVGQPSQPTISRIVQNPASEFLREQVQASRGLIAEAFVMDYHGLNVAAAAATSDYWQGDEAKFIETFPRGSHAMHISDVDFDESAHLFLIQVSFTISDPATGAPIGAITIGLNAELLD
jgi:hypothetical protein